MFKKASDILSDYYYFQADINGNSSAPDMSGTARFYPWLDGTMVEIELSGMPARNERLRFIFTRMHSASQRKT